MLTAIVGYGIGGISAAIHLRRVGHRIEHFERNRASEGQGGGMLLHPPALRQLQKLGLLPAAVACGAPVRRIHAQTVRGQTLMDLDYTGLLDGQHGIGIQRGVLHRLLSDADSGRADVRHGEAVDALDAHHGLLVDASGRRHGPYDLIVLADGAHSRLRDQMPVSARRNQREDSAALVTLLEDPGRIAADRLVQYFDGGRHLSHWPVGSRLADAVPHCSVAMNVPLSEVSAFADHPRWREQAGRLCPAVGKLLADQSRAPDWLVYTYRDVELGTCAAGRAVLLGDAAHSMSPQLGVGAQLAMEDADILATTLTAHADVVTALSQYSQRRAPVLRRYQEASRWLTPLFQADSPLLSGLRDSLMGRWMSVPMVKRLAQELLS